MSKPTDECTAPTFSFFVQKPDDKRPCPWRPDPYVRCSYGWVLRVRFVQPGGNVSRVTGPLEWYVLGHEAVTGRSDQRDHGRQRDSKREVGLLVCGGYDMFFSRKLAAKLQSSATHTFFGYDTFPSSIRGCSCDHRSTRWTSRDGIYPDRFRTSGVAGQSP